MHARGRLSPLLMAVVLAGCTVASGHVTAPIHSGHPFIDARAGATKVPTKASPTSVATGTATSSVQCPVTRPGDPGFVAPTPFPAVPPGYYESRWYGTPGLWTMLSPTGEYWHHLPRDRASLGQKTFWWSTLWSPASEPDPGIVVTGRRLDGPAPDVRAGDPGTNATADFGTAMLVGLGVPMPGCWELRARYRSAELAIVVWVADD